MKIFDFLYYRPFGRHQILVSNLSVIPFIYIGGQLYIYSY